MTTYEWLLLLHLIGVVLLVAGVGATTVLGIAQTRTGEPRLMGRLARLSIVSDLGLIYPGLIVTLVFGSLLVDESGHEFDETWITVAYILWIAAVLVGLLVLSPATRRLRRHADALAAEGVTDSPELRRRAASPLVGIPAVLVNLSLIAFLYLMVAKPGA